MPGSLAANGLLRDTSNMTDNKSAAAKKSGWRWLWYVMLIIVVVPLIGFATWVWGTLHLAYSSGERSGYIQKISNKGWVCKTWEGELAMTTSPGTAPQIFAFSVRDAGVAHQLMELDGKRAVINYEQHRFVPTNCFGETEYYVTGAKEVQQ